MDVLAQLTTTLADRYHVEREIGRGGMATVYLARDLRHDRQVALKVLNPELGAVLGVERFLSEIKVTANLQHPNLLPLFDSGAADGLLFYVMPYVSGESLRHRLDREKQLPVDDAVHIAVAVAGALDYAHAHRVIHRDLKPENILLLAGQPVIADFGIALAVSNAGGPRITQTGLSLGTPLYMSPEQATGDRIIDGRSDIYSLAAMTYEMLTGDPPHTASTTQAIIAKVLTERPVNVRVLRSAVSETVAYAVHRALEKLPADRWATAAQFVDALQGRAVAVTASHQQALATGTTERASRYFGWRMSASVLAASMVLAVAGVWGWMNPRTAEAPSPVRFELSLPSITPLEAGAGTPLVLTPNADALLYDARGPNGRQQYRRTMDQLGTIPVAGTERAEFATTSPDGRWIAFLADAQLKKVPIDGGTPTTVANVSGATGTSWGRGDVIVLGSKFGGTGLSRISASGGTLRPLTYPDTARGEASHYWPRVLPDGKTVVFTIFPRRGGLDSARIGVASVESGAHSALDLYGTNPFGVFSDVIVYARSDGSIMASAIDLADRRITGDAVLVVSEVAIGGAGASKADISAGGTLVYLIASSGDRLMLVDMKGVARTLSPKAQRYAHPSFSPDGRRIAVTLFERISRGRIWVHDIAAGTFIPLTVGDTASDIREPAWSPDGSRIVFRSVRAGTWSIWWQAADGSAPPEPLVTADVELSEPTMSQDGRMLIYRKGSVTAGQFWYRTLSGDTTPRRLFISNGGEQSPSLSPDGRWLAYQSSEAGPTQIFVRPVLGAPSKWPVSDGDGSQPRWAPDGRTIFYRSAKGMVAAHVSTEPVFSVTSREVLFPDMFSRNRTHHNYDVSPDCKHFVLLQRGDSASSVIVVTNWLTELRARMAGTRGR